MRRACGRGWRQCGGVERGATVCGDAVLQASREGSDLGVRDRTDRRQVAPDRALGLKDGSAIRSLAGDDGRGHHLQVTQL